MSRSFNISAAFLHHGEMESSYSPSWEQMTTPSISHFELLAISVVYFLFLIVKYSYWDWIYWITFNLKMNIKLKKNLILIILFPKIYRIKRKKNVCYINSSPTHFSLPSAVASELNKNCFRFPGDFQFSMKFIIWKRFLEIHKCQWT